MEGMNEVNEELLQRLTNGMSEPEQAAGDPALRRDKRAAGLPLSPRRKWQSGCEGRASLTRAQLFSLNKEELRAVIPKEGARVYSQLTVQKALLEDARRATELETVMEKQKLKVDHNLESGTL
uniref:SAM domain-containing protein n=1 Tax=Knipowitschia caucasica TaxID=637954 RepID=A0AAV2LFF6_KNICA